MCQVPLSCALIKIQRAMTSNELIDSHVLMAYQIIGWRIKLSWLETRHQELSQNVWVDHTHTSRVPIKCGWYLTHPKTVMFVLSYLGQNDPKMMVPSISTGA